MKGIILLFILETRNTNRIVLNVPGTTMYRKKMLSVDVIIYNAITDNIKESPLNLKSYNMADRGVLLFSIRIQIHNPY